MRARKLLVLLVACGAVSMFATPALASSGRTVSLLTPTASVDAGTNAVVRIALSGSLPAGKRASVRVFTVDGTAVAGVDYVKLDQRVTLTNAMPVATVSIATMYRATFPADARALSVHITGAKNARVGTASVLVTIAPSYPGFWCLYLASAGEAEWNFPNITGATGYDLTFTANGRSWSTTIPNDPNRVGGEVTYDLPIGMQIAPFRATATAIWLPNAPRWFAGCGNVTGF